MDYYTSDVQMVMSQPLLGPPALPLSQTETGALATAPLSTVINAATNELYQDLYNLVHGEIEIVSVASSSDDQLAESTSTSAAPLRPKLESRKQRMSALSFAQRRHELTSRIVRHTKSISHAFVSTAASMPDSHAAWLKRHRVKSPSTTALLPSTISTTSTKLGLTVQLSSDAFKYVKNAWTCQDEAQDALYFHHEMLWKARSHCHDVIGALCVLSTAGGQNGLTGGGRWPDFPTDVALSADPYESSKENNYSRSELQARFSSAVRRKLVLGEVGAFGVANEKNTRLLDTNTAHEIPLPWRVTMEQGGGAVRLTYGNPRMLSTAKALTHQTDENDPANNVNNSEIGHSNNDYLQQYPMEARLSVLSEASNAPWKLLSIHVRCSPKTGESDHQLAMNKKQMFDLHRIGERVMTVEEAICRKYNQQRADDTNNESFMDAVENHVVQGSANARNSLQTSTIVPRPLLRLFEVTHSFALSLQLEMLTSQAEALRRGAWGGRGSHTKEMLGDGIAVSPAYFFDEEKDIVSTSGSGVSVSPIAVMAVHFWSCDNRYGSPKIGDITPENAINGKKGVHTISTSSSTDGRSAKPGQRMDDNFLPMLDCQGEKCLSLCIRAVPMVGLVVSLSGGADVMSLLIDIKAASNNSTYSHHIERNVTKLLSSIQNPFQLSMSDALLAATVLCAECRCQSVVAALIRQRTNKIPSWIQLNVECGSIAIAARITYPTSSTMDLNVLPFSRPHVVLFRLACDSRTGRFVPVFPRPASLLRLLACNDPSVSDIQALRAAAMTSTVNARLGTGLIATSSKLTDGSAREATGRIVRDAFDALSRSFDTLGRRCGVGGEWNDCNPQSASLREKSIDQACHDVRISLMTCSGMAALFGVAAIALKVVGGVNPGVDMAGGPIEETTPDFLRVPPLSLLLHQRMVEQKIKGGSGEKRQLQIEGHVLAVSARASEESLELICFEGLTVLESASSVPTRIKLAQVLPKEKVEIIDLDVTRPSKRSRIEQLRTNNISHHTLEEVEYATSWLDAILNQ